MQTHASHGDFTLFVVVVVSHSSGHMFSYSNIPLLSRRMRADMYEAIFEKENIFHQLESERT